MKKSFTLIELVIVIVTMGILSTTIIPKIQNNSLNEAAIQLLNHIKYTQHLALVNDKYDVHHKNWFKKRWQIVFITSKAANGGPSYTIFADTSGSSTGDANEIEIALNPLNNNQRLTGGHSGDINLDINSPSFVGMKNLNLKLAYGITDLKLSNSCKVYGSKRIYFDYLGRPIKGKLGKASNGGNKKSYEKTNLITQKCKITLIRKNAKISLIIAPETGYICIKNKINDECR